ncbi:MAG: T9SS type A sorting domain-containing protein, partial [Ignavibacteriae bacterium]|nr:T9SS type A sorting domain-containing protein [Ignavibacteriota bacterium]
GIYNENPVMMANNIGSIDYGIYIINPNNPMYTKVAYNNINQNLNGIYTKYGIRVFSFLPSTVNPVGIALNNIVANRYGIYAGNCLSGLLIDNNKVHLKGALSLDAKILRFGIRVENGLNALVSCNLVDRTPFVLPQRPYDLYMHGISISQSNNAEVNRNTVKFMGAGINVYGNCNFTKFDCNELESDFYGFLFNQSSTITEQGSPNKFSDNKFKPDGNYTASSGGYTYERKLWASNSLMTSPINWWYQNNSYIYDPANNMNVINPTYSTIIPQIPLQQNNPTSSCEIGCIDYIFSHSAKMTIEEREEKFGVVVRDLDSYPELEEQYKAYNRYTLFQLLRSNDSLIYMGDTTDYLYEEFYNNALNGNIGMYDSLLNMVAMGDIDQALVLNNAIQDEKLIDSIQVIVNRIYLNTFARDIYQLDSSQYLTLYDIATNYTPWAGGIAVLTARYMLGIDVDLSNPDVQFALGPHHNQPDIPLLQTYPNPASDKLTMEFRDAVEDGFTIDVYNYLGVKVLSEKVSQIEAEHILNISTLSNGIYIYNITTTSNTFKGKFTVLK